MLIICPNSYKEELLKRITREKKLFNIKFMSMMEYQKKFYFDYGVDAIHYLVNKKMKVENAITLLNNLYYIEDKCYQEEKLDYLVSIKKELDEHNLLIYDNLFQKMLQRYQVVIYGYGKISRWMRKMFPCAIIVDYEEKQSHFKVANIPSINDEVEFVFQQICHLLTSGVDINKISIMNVDNEYLPILKRMSLFYQIPISLPDNSTILGTTFGKYFYQLVSEHLNKEAIYEKLNKYKENSNYNTLIQLLNKYVDFDIKSVENEIKYDLENTKVIEEHFDNTVKIKNVFDYISDDEYVFLVGFNNPSIPNLSLDIDYITDNIKDLVGIDKTLEKNNLSKENTLNYLKSINNLIISYKTTTTFNKYYPSILLDNMDYEEIEYQRKYNYSILANKSLYTNYLDDLVKYGIKNKDLDLLYTNYGKNDYLSYDNTFTNINREELLDYLKGELALSFSSVDNFYKCAFRYYLSNILHVDIYEERFQAIIGKLFHYVLSHMNDDDFNLDRHYNLFIQDYEWNNKERYFLEKLKKNLIDVIEVIKKHQFITGFSKMLYEHKLDIPIKKSPYVHFKGYVDKIMYQEKNEETLVSIIDYKTYDLDIRISHLEFGLSMQLPMYLYLVKNSNLFTNPKFAGFYLQNILNKKTKVKNKTQEEILYNKLKLNGYTTSDLHRLSIFDSTYENSEMIKGIKLTKDGKKKKKCRVLSDEEIDDIIDLTNGKIHEAMEMILNGEFPINPKIINGKNVSCDFCSYRDICYLEDKNKIYLKSKDGDIDESDTGTEVSD